MNIIVGPKLKFALIGAFLGILVFIGGFFEFTNRIPRQKPANIAKADAIVVLTGGKSRVIDALKLLAEKKGSRLLISGVHQTTSLKSLRKIAPSQSALLDCCVDLDKAARNTIGNAAETATWVSSNKFKSLIVVTSSYHMPRGLAELKGVLPKVTLTAYPVFVTSVPVSRWWTNPGTARLLFSEYVKYLETLIRLSLSKT